MSLVDRLRGRQRFGTTELDESLVGELRETATRHIDDGATLLAVRPYKEASGWGDGEPERFARAFHQTDRGDGVPTYAHEVWFDGHNLRFIISTPNPEEVRDLVDSLYPNSTVAEVPPDDAFLDVEAGDVAAAARLRLTKDSAFPTSHADSRPPLAGDAYNVILPKATNEHGERVLIQTVFRPVGREWFNRGVTGADSDTIADSVKQGRVVGEVNPRIVESQADKNTAKDIQDQRGRPAFTVTLRVVVVGDHAPSVVDRIESVTDAFSEYDHDAAEQGFDVDALRGRDVGRALVHAADRHHEQKGRVARWLRGPDDVLTDRQLGAVAHLAGAEVNVPEIDRSHTKAGNPVPPRTPRFDFEAVGVDPRHATPTEKFRAMVRHGHETPGTTDDAIWLGEGTRGGTEAGLPMKDLLHLNIVGKSGHGKSKEVLSIFYQLLERGVGAFYADPKKGDDAHLAVALAMLAGRGDDVIPIRVGSDTDHQVTFNFLEVPGKAEPGTREYVDKLEPMADVVEGVLAQASGAEKEDWGTRMSGITRHLVRGLGQLDLDTPPTLMTMNYAGATETDRNTYADYVNDQSIPFIEDTAQDVFAEYDSNAVEPWARRVNQVVESAPLRDVACNPHGISLADAVREGKIIVLFGETASDTALKMLMTALVPSLWNVTQELHNDDDEPTPPPFHAFVDELNDIVTPRMDLPQILSNARAYDFHLHGIYQDGDSQLNEDVAKAFEGQADTLSVYPGTEDFAKSLASHHSEDVGYQELMDLPHFRQYVRTRDKTGEKTRSYPVNLGHPLHEIDDEVPSSDEALALVEEREREIGHEKRTPEQIKADDPFAQSDTDGEGFVVTEAVEQAAVQGIYDTAIRQGDREGYVTLADAHSAVTRRLSRLEETPADVDGFLPDGKELWRRVIQHVGDDLLECGDDGETFRAASPRSTIATVGDDQSAGGPGHAGIMWDSYHGLTWAGLDLTINDASGDDADALARPAPLEEQHAPELVERLTGGGEARVESEHSTGRTKAGVTAQHVLQAANEGRRAIVLSRPDDAQNIVDTLRVDPPFARSDHAVDGETRFYTSPQDLRVDGEAMTRPGSRSNVWIHDDETGEIMLKDDGGAEHARFEGVETVFTDANPYPDGGEKAIKRPIIPFHLLDDDAEVSEEIVTVPEGAESLADLSLVVGADELTVPADAVGRDDAYARNSLDVPDRAEVLLDVLREEQGGPWTTADAHALAHDSDDDDLHVGKRAIRKYLRALADEGVLDRETGDHAAAPDEYSLVRFKR